MAFTVEEFWDLVRLLEQQPQWRVELRRLLLTDELLSLPQTIQALSKEVRALAEAQRRTEEQITVLTQRLDILTQRVDALTQRVDTLTERVDTLTQRVDTLTQDVQLLTKRVDSLSQDVGYLKGSDVERSYREKGHAYFRPLLRRIHVLSTNEISLLLDQAVEERKLSDADADELSQADVIVRGRRREDEAEAYLVAEVSWGIGPHDVERAAKRATLLAKLGAPVIPVVAGKVITYEAADLARRMKTWQVLDGQVISPTEVPFEHNTL